MQNRTYIKSAVFFLLCISFLTSCAKNPDSPARKIPSECTSIISATERYWQIYWEVQEDPKRGLDLQKELLEMDVPSEMLPLRIKLTYLLEDEYGCWFSNSYYHCSDIERNYEEFNQKMEYLWYIDLPNSLSACAPYLEAIYLENQR